MGDCSGGAGRENVNTRQTWRLTKRARAAIDFMIKGLSGSVATVNHSLPMYSGVDGLAHN